MAIVVREQPAHDRIAGVHDEDRSQQGLERHVGGQQVKAGEVTEKDLERHASFLNIGAVLIRERVAPALADYYIDKQQ
jgi:hypothetical protein